MAVAKWLETIADAVSANPTTVANYAAVATLTLTLIGILASLGNVRYQIRRQWLLASAEMVTDFEKRFVSREWKRYRTFCGQRLQEHWSSSGTPLTLSEDFPVLGMFEHLASLVRRGVLDTEMVWSKFGWYYIRYYEALTTGPYEAIEAVRAREADPTLWEEFEWMYKHMVRHYRKRNTPLSDSAQAERVRELLAQELTLLTHWEEPVRSQIEQQVGDDRVGFLTRIGIRRPRRLRDGQ